MKKDKNKEKQDRINSLIEKIEGAVATGSVIEKKFKKTTGCILCAFKKECVVNIKLPCMAHNRKKRDSIYYSHANNH